jgi:hypothetical protein
MHLKICRRSIKEYGTVLMGPHIQHVFTPRSRFSFQNNPMVNGAARLRPHAREFGVTE